MTKAPSRITAISLAVFVTFLWSTSWILIKIGLQASLPPITFAGLRYSLAFLCLIPFVLLNSKPRREVMGLRGREWLVLGILGLLTYTITQTAQYLALVYLPAAMLSLLLNLTSVFVAVSGIYVLKETPSPLQWTGIALTALGMATYFLPIAISGAQWAGVLFALVCLGGNGIASLLGRHINRKDIHSPLLVTIVSMGAGSVLMLILGLSIQGLGELSSREWAIIGWLAVVNTALTFTIWNNTLRTLTAIESSIINSLMMPQIAIMGYVFLRESLSVKEIAGLVLVGIGVVIVQLRRSHAAIQSELSTGRTV